MNKSSIPVGKIFYDQCLFYGCALPNYSLPYNFYDSKICFSSCRERGTKKTLFFHEDSGFFSLSHSQDKIKKYFAFLLPTSKITLITLFP